jgi:hypothetical protein
MTVICRYMTSYDGHMSGHQDSRWQSPPGLGPHHDSAIGYRPWGLCRFAQYSLVCSGITPFSASATTDTGPKSFECALVSTLETYDDPENGNYMHYIHYIHYLSDNNYINYVCTAGWLKSAGSQIVYELVHKKPVLYVIPIEHILGKLPVVPVGDAGTILHHLRNVFQGAPGDCRPDAGDGCKMWFVKPWAGPVICNEWNGGSQHWHGERFRQ